MAQVVITYTEPEYIKLVGSHVDEGRVSGKMDEENYWNLVQEEES